jgi:hypothetical protein
MVEVAKEGSLNGNIRDTRTSRSFPDEEYTHILSAVKDAPSSTLINNKEGLDSYIARELPEYHFEQATDSGRNSECKLWAPDFDNSVDLYHPNNRIAIEIEKTQQKRVSDDILKFIKGGKTQRKNRKKIEFGCLIVPVNSGMRGNDLYNETMRSMRFIRSVLHVEDVAVIGYREP